ncbi:MAG: BufA2 family periplasmic bufferin-type metallophore [Methyloceanibacter sp.]
MKASIRSGVSIAVAAAALILAGAVQAPASAAEPGQGHCVGANACKGKGACKSASNDCKGQKGKGYLTMTKEECDKIEGATFETAG